MFADRSVHCPGGYVSGMSAKFDFNFLEDHFDSLSQSPRVIIRRGNTISVGKLIRLHSSAIP